MHIWGPKRPAATRVRVLHVIPSLDPESGGPARSIPFGCAALARAGAETTLYAFLRPGALTTLDGRDWPFTTRLFSPLPFTNQVPTLDFITEFRRAIHRADLVHLYSVWNPLVSLCAFLCRQKKVPYVLSPRGMLQSGALARRRLLKRVIFNAWDHRTIRGASACHFLTEGEAADSRTLCGSTPSIVVPSGVEEDEVARADANRFFDRHPDLKSRPIMLFMGRLHEVKRLDLQLAALISLKDRFPDLAWVLAGSDDGAWDGISRAAEAAGMAGRVKWIGFEGGPGRFDALAAARVFVLTSRHEAHSMAMNEALACGVPVVLADTVRFDAVQKHGAGLSVPAEPGAIATAIAGILNDARKAQQMGEAGRALARSELTWTRFAERMMLAYEAILTRKPLPAAGI